MLNIVQNESKGAVYNNVSGLSSMRAKEASKAPELVNPPKVLDLSNPDVEIFKSLPTWVQELITKENLDFSGSPLQKLLEVSKKSSAGSVPEEESEALSKAPMESEDTSDDEDW